MVDAGWWIEDDGEFWVNFRQEDRICRKGVKKKLKPETGNWRGSGEWLVTGGW
jgi:hypothetical protein